MGGRWRKKYFFFNAVLNELVIDEFEMLFFLANSYLDLFWNAYVNTYFQFIRIFLSQYIRKSVDKWFHEYWTIFKMEMEIETWHISLNAQLK